MGLGFSSEAANLTLTAINQLGHWEDGAINDEGVCLPTLTEWWILQQLLYCTSSSIFYFYDFGDYLIIADSVFSLLAINNRTTKNILLHLL